VEEEKLDSQFLFQVLDMAREGGLGDLSASEALRKLQSSAMRMK